MKNLIPKNKFDEAFILKLQRFHVNEIREIIPELLTWLQDGNWPVSKYITQYFLPYINDIKDEIILILKGNDEIWKYWILICLLQKSPYRLDNEILEVLGNIKNFPRDSEKEEELDQLAHEVLEKYYK